ncbi:MAG TPA: YciI family protein [Thermoanaerobaculia bacterium]|nr:YciI family protein [Thermoanaerobaculia bacterium]
MNYILLIYGDEKAWGSLSKEEMEKVYEGHRAYGEAMAAAGVMRGGAELKPVSTATSVRFSKGRPKTVDGPFAETKEQLGGYYLIDVENLEQAIEWAEKMPGMTEGTVEVRPLGEGS